MAIVNELATVLDFVVPPAAKAAIEFIESSTQRIVDSMKNIGFVAAGAQAGIAVLANKYSESAREISRLADMTGNSVEEIQQMRYAFASLGGDADDANNVLSSLNDTMYSVIQGNYNETLVRMGINIRKNNGDLKTSNEIFYEVADALKNISSAGEEGRRNAVKWASELGITGNAVDVLLQGSDKLKMMSNEAKNAGIIFNKDQINSGREFYNSLNKVKYTLEQTYMSIMAHIMPAVNNMMNKFVDWTKSSKDASNILDYMKKITEGLTIGFEKFCGWVIKIGDAIFSTIKPFMNLGDSMVSVEGIANIVAMALSALAVSIMAINWHTILVVGTITLLIAAFKKIQDNLPKIIDWFDRLKSSFSDSQFAEDLINGLSEISSWFDKISDSKIYKAIKGYINEFGILGGILNAINDIWNPIIAGAKSALQIIWGMVKSIGASVAGIMEIVSAEGIKGKLSALKNFGGIIKDNFSPAFDTLSNVNVRDNVVNAASIQRTSLMNAASTGISLNNQLPNTTNNNNTNNINVVINTKDNPKSISRSLIGALESNANMNTGG